MNLSCILHELKEDRAWQQLYFDLYQARKAVNDNDKLKAYELTQYERDLIGYNITQLDEALNACNDYYARFIARSKND